MAAAAGVHPSYVTINDVMTQGGRRRALLSLDSSSGQETIDVHASVTGAVRLRDLDKHLGRHSSTLHIAHKWQQAPQIHAVAIKGDSAPSTRRMTKAPTAATQRSVSSKPSPQAPPQQPTAAERMSARERVKARSIKLVNKDFLMNMLNQD